MIEKNNSQAKLDPELRNKLLNEFKTPWRGLRRVLWIALLGSAFIGLFVMTFRIGSGQDVLMTDISIQVSAVFLFGFLLWIDRKR